MVWIVCMWFIYTGDTDWRPKPNWIELYRLPSMRRYIYCVNCFTKIEPFNILCIYNLAHPVTQFAICTVRIVQHISIYLIWPKNKTQNRIICNMVSGQSVTDIVLYFVLLFASNIGQISHWKTKRNWIKMLQTFLLT